MKINELTRNVIKSFDPKTMYEWNERCKRRAKEVLTLAEAYRRTVSIADVTYTWIGTEHLWLLETPKFSNYIPRNVAIESLADHLYSGNEWKWVMI